MQGRSQGFTLIEMITVIVIVSVLSGLTVGIIKWPVVAYTDLQRRNTLADSAESALMMMQRDIRRALPNSIRISNGALELLHVSDGGRYRAALTSLGAGNILDFTQADSQFDVMGSLSAAPTGSVVVYNLGNTQTNAYTGNNRAALSNNSTSINIVLATATQFPLASPQQRFFIVDTPITYACSNNTLLRYSGYIITSAQVYPPNGVVGEIQANNVSACTFSYNAGSATRGGLLTVNITLTDSSGESITLIHQIHVDNSP